MTQSISARTRLLTTATQQFFEYGYRGVGIDQIIHEAGISKATFYAHFPSKERLYVETLSQTSAQSLAYLQDFIESRGTPLDKLLAPMDFLLQVLPQKGFRGCPFINMTAEIYDCNSAARQIGHDHYKKIETIIAQCAANLVASDPTNYAHLRPATLAQRYMALYTGGVTLAALWQESSPLHSARDMALKLIRWGQ